MKSIAPTACLAILTAAGLLTAASARADDVPPAPAAPPPATQAPIANAFATTGQLAVPAGPDRAFNPLNDVEISGSQGSSNATITVQLEQVSGLVKAKKLSSDFAAYGGGFSLSVSTPLSKSADSTNLTTLSGLATSTNISLQWTGFLTSGFKPLSGPNGNDAQKLCNALFHKYVDPWVAANPGKTPPKLADPYCEVADLEALKAKIGVGPTDGERLELSNYAWANETPSSLWLFGGSGTVGDESHTFYNAVSLAKSSLNRTPLQFGGYLTWVAGQRNLSATLQLDYQNSYTDNPTKTVCPAGGSGPVTCVNGAFGPPKTTDKALVAGELRWFGQVDHLPIGVDPMVTYDAASGAYAFDLPVYLFSDGKDNLTGGIRYDWTSVKHASVVGVFIAKAFNIGAFSSPAS